MRKKFKVFNGDTGLEFKPGHGSMVMMNQDGVFFIGRDLNDYYPSVQPLKNVLPKYDIKWNDQ